MDRAIVVDKLVKNFEIIQKEPGFKGVVSSVFSPKKKTINALKNISFSVQPGELVGFIGPNGAGKTTTLKILSGLLYPTSGFVEVLETDPWEKKPEYLKRIALVMGQKNQLWWDLPVIETFELNKVIYDIPQKEYAQNLQELVNLLGVVKLLKTQVRKLSLGQRMKMELIAALLHKPNILFLDEPTIGLDIIAQQKIRDFIYDYNRKYNATIILTSHNMDDLVNLARRVIVINNGQIVFDGLLEKLAESYAKEKIIKVRLGSEDNIKEIEKIGRVKEITFPQVTIVVPRSAVSVAAAELLQNFPVEDLTIDEIPIEEVIRKFYKDTSSGKVKIDRK